jgi:hypothetical protein
MTTLLTTERRFALGTRRLVEEMTREEMRRELLTSEVTGLPIVAPLRKLARHLRLGCAMQMGSKP